MSAEPTPATSATGPIVPCPSCRRPTPYVAGNPWRPFCSERCRLSDLGAWATEQFRVEGHPPDEDDDEAALRAASGQPPEPH